MHQIARPKNAGRRTPEQQRMERIRYSAWVATIGLLLLLNLTGVFRTAFGLDTAAIIAVLAGYRTFYHSIAALLEKQITADLAICIAVIAALAAGEYLAAAEAMFIILVGEGLESYAAERTSAAIQRFVEQMPRKARLLRAGEEIEVMVEQLAPGDLILVRAGERIPADGAVAQGVSSVDESTITGEPVPKDKKPGDAVFAGTLNGNALLQIQVSKAGSDTTLAHVVRLVEEAKQRRAPIERLADRYARFFLPALLIAAALTFYFTRDWLRTVAVLIVGCPCALILATPTAMVAAIGGLARRGILVRGGSVLQLASKVDTVVFDKTGTLTEGKFEIIRVIAFEGAEENVLRFAAAAERGSDHVLARVIVEAARARSLDIPLAEDARVLAGRGAECTLNGLKLRAGNAQFLAEHGILDTAAALEEADHLGATAVLVAADNRLIGAILLRDRIRQGVKKAVHDLGHLGIRNVIMLTGDRRRAAEVIARELRIPHVDAELLPEQKLDRIRHLSSHGHVVAMAGDGINDAPALAAADVGIAVHGASDITAEAADVVYMGQSLENLPRFFEASRRAMGLAWQNIIVFAGVVNCVAVLACATGTLGPLGAAFTHQLSSFLVMMNSLRLLRVGGGKQSRLRHWLHHRRHDLEHWWEDLDLRSLLGAAWRQRARWRRPVLAALALALVLNGFYIVRPDEVGLIERFGKKVLPYRDPGLHYKLPWPIEKLTRIQARRTRTLEIGYRSAAGAAAEAEPATYEWNVQHRAGRFQRKPEESQVLTGDQNMIEITAAIHYRLARPDDYVFNLLDGESAVRAAGESALHSVFTATPLDEALTAGRRALETRLRQLMQQRLDRYGSGIEVLQARLLDVHPSVEVVDAFRDVSGAFEEKIRLMNEAEGYRNEQVALARGNAQARLLAAQGYAAGRKNRAEGEAGRFAQAEAAFRSAPGPTETRLYLETLEQVLPGKRKLIVDAGRGRRHLLLVEDGVQIAPPAAGLLAPPSRPPREEEEE